MNLWAGFKFCYTQTRFNTSKLVLCYVKGALCQGHLFECNNDNAVRGFVNLDYGNGLDSKQSVTGYLSTFGGCNVSWSSYQQETVLLSMTKAEYMSITDCAVHTLWFKKPLIDIDLPICPIPIKSSLDVVRLFNDNCGAIILAKDPIVNKRSENIDLWYHFMQNHTRLGNDHCFCSYVTPECQP